MGETAIETQRAKWGAGWGETGLRKSQVGCVPTRARPGTQASGDAMRLSTHFQLCFSTRPPGDGGSATCPGFTSSQNAELAKGPAFLMEGEEAEARGEAGGREAAAGGEAAGLRGGAGRDEGAEAGRET